SQEPLTPHRAQPTQDAGKLEGRDAANAEHVDGLGVVAEHQWAALHWAPPEALFAERNLPVVEGQTGVGVEQLDLIDGSKRRCGRNTREDIDRTDELSRGQGLRGSGGRMLVFGPDVARPASACGPCGN